MIGPQIAEILADFTSVVQYGIGILHVFESIKYCQTAKQPNLIPRQISRLHGMLKMHPLGTSVANKVFLALSPGSPLTLFT